MPQNVPCPYDIKLLGGWGGGAGAGRGGGWRGWGGGGGGTGVAKLHLVGALFGEGLFWWGTLGMCPVCPAL